MGFTNLLAKTFGNSFVEALKERDPSLFVLLDYANEMPIWEAASLSRNKAKQLFLEAQKMPSFRMPDEKPPIDWFGWFVQTTQRPITEVARDFLLHEFSITEISGVSIDEFLNAVTEVGDDKK